MVGGVGAGVEGEVRGVEGGVGDGAWLGVLDVDGGDGGGVDGAPPA